MNYFDRKACSSFNFQGVRPYHGLFRVGALHKNGYFFQSASQIYKGRNFMSRKYEMAKKIDYSGV